MHTQLESLFERFESVVVLDTETTGLSMQNDEIIEIGAVRLCRGPEGPCSGGDLSCLIQLTPGRTLPPKIIELTGITPQMLAQEGISKQEAARQLQQLLAGPDTLVVAYNAQFDLNFLFYFLHRYADITVLKNAQLLDALTVYRDRQKYPHRLENAIEAYHLGDRAVNSHRAIDDARATVELLMAMEREYDDLPRYLNLFGYHPKYGVSGKRIRSVTYRPQPYYPHPRLYESTECPQQQSISL